MIPRVALAPFLVLFLAGCTDSKATAEADGRSAAKPSLSEKAALPSGVAQEVDPQVTGTVLETMDAGPYTYIRLKTSSEEIWAAVNEVKLKPGSEITIGNAMWMEKFESKTLNRKFDRILFGSLASGETTALPAGHPPPGHPPPGHPMTATADTPLPVGSPSDAPVEKATGENSHTVAEIYASKATLKGKEVVVRGRVVKYNREIMGRNWIHLRDGSGSADKQDNDITVTTTATAAKGDIITIRGRVALDKDFTAGYAYPVIIEEARIVK